MFPAYKLFYFTPHCNNVADEARPLSVVHGIIATIVFNFLSNSLDDADKWHRFHSMRCCCRGCGAIACEFEAS